MRLKIWMRMNWVDQRLSWNPDDYGGIEQIWLNQQHGEPLVEHWAPDITPYNTREGLDKTLDAAQALVYSDGSVFWSRSPRSQPLPVARSEAVACGREACCVTLVLVGLARAFWTSCANSAAWQTFRSTI